MPQSKLAPQKPKPDRPRDLELNFASPSFQSDAICCLISIREVLALSTRPEDAHLVAMIDRVMVRRGKG